MSDFNPYTEGDNSGKLVDVMYELTSLAELSPLVCPILKIKTILGRWAGRQEGRHSNSSRNTTILTRNTSVIYYVAISHVCRSFESH